MAKVMASSRLDLPAPVWPTTATRRLSLKSKDVGGFPRCERRPEISIDSIFTEHYLSRLLTHDNFSFALVSERLDEIRCG